MALDLLIVLITLAFIITLYTLYSIIYKENSLSPIELKIPETDHHFETAEELSPQMEITEELFPQIHFPPDPVTEHVPDLPGGYDDNRIIIMPRDPEWLFVYWNINQFYYDSVKNHHQSLWENSYPILRVYTASDINQNNPQFIHCFDVRINDSADNWYINVQPSDKAYRVELGRILQNGTYLSLLRSNAAVMPRNRISDKVDPAWMLVSDKERKLFDSIGHRENISSGIFANNSQNQ